MNKPSRIGWLVLTPAFLLMAGCGRTVAKKEVGQAPSDSAETTGRAGPVPGARGGATESAGVAASSAGTPRLPSGRGSIDRGERRRSVTGGTPWISASIPPGAAIA